jgi:hypothetical protein
MKRLIDSNQGLQCAHAQRNAMCRAKFGFGRVNANQGVTEFFAQLLSEFADGG